MTNLLIFPKYCLLSNKNSWSLPRASKLFTRLLKQSQCELKKNLLKQNIFFWRKPKNIWCVWILSAQLCYEMVIPVLQEQMYYFGFATVFVYIFQLEYYTSHTPLHTKFYTVWTRQNLGGTRLHAKLFFRLLWLLENNEKRGKGILHCSVCRM